MVASKLSLRPPYQRYIIQFSSFHGHFRGTVSCTSLTCTNPACDLMTRHPELALTTVMCSQDPATGNWWLQLRDLKWGYWPASLFNGLSKTADVILWGGKVMSQGDPPPESPHTKTQMGSGHSSDEGFGKSCYIRDLWYMRSDRPQHLLGDLHKYMTRPECYDLKAGGSDKWGVYFYFGGPGYSDKCPKSGKWSSMAMLLHLLMIIQWLKCLRKTPLQIVLTSNVGYHTWLQLKLDTLLKYKRLMHYN